MSEKKSLIIILFFFFQCSEGSGQNFSSTNLRWDVDQMTNIINSEATPFAGSWFLSSQDGSVQWIQDGGKSIFNLLRKDVSGAWMDVSGNGSVEISVQIDNINGIVIFSRDASGACVTVDFSNNQNGLKAKFRVTSITPQTQP